MVARSGLFVDPVPGSPPVGTSMADGRRVLAAVSGITFRALTGGTVTTSGSAMDIVISQSVWSIPDPIDSTSVFWTPTDAVTVTPAAGPGTGSRIDLILIKQNNYGAGDADSRATVYLKAGTASGTPTPPAVDAGAQVIATITVPTGAANSAACTVAYGRPRTRTTPPPITATTLALLTASPGEVAGQLAGVTGDTAAANNGLYQWTGSQWTQLNAQGVWTPFASFASGITANAFGYPPSWKSLGDTVMLAGAIKKSSGAAFADGDSILTLPAGLVPAQASYFLANGSGTGFASLQAASSGAVTIHSAKGTSPAWLSLDGWAYRRV